MSDLQKYKRRGLYALKRHQFDAAKMYFALGYSERKDKASLCFMLLCDVAKANLGFARMIIKDLAANGKNQPQEYLDYLLDFLLKYSHNKLDEKELECISYDDFTHIINSSKSSKKEQIISIINSSRIAIGSKKELVGFLHELMKARLYDVALSYCEQTYMHFMGDEYFAKIVSMLMEKMKNASKN